MSHEYAQNIFPLLNADKTGKQLFCNVHNDDNDASFAITTVAPQYAATKASREMKMSRHPEERGRSIYIKRVCGVVGAWCY